MKVSWTAIKETIRRAIVGRRGAILDTEQVKQMARGIMTTRPDEIGCDECMQELDAFVDMTLAGRDAATAMPLVEDHLVRCGDCREEFEALLAAVQALA
ncbi:MAG: hypothetical protein PVJ34_11330 [Anaerolineae bacterium]|jgi:hypothetical protein